LEDEDSDIIVHQVCSWGSDMESLTAFHPVRTGMPFCHKA